MLMLLKSQTSAIKCFFFHPLSVEFGSQKSDVVYNTLLVFLPLIDGKSSNNYR